MTSVPAEASGTPGRGAVGAMTGERLTEAAALCGALRETRRVQLLAPFAALHDLLADHARLTAQVYGLYELAADLRRRPAPLDGRQAAELIEQRLGEAEADLPVPYVLTDKAGGDGDA